MPARALPGAVGELAASRHGAITRRQAAEFLNPMAITRLRRRGVFLEPAPGVLLMPGAPATYQQHAYVATLAGGGRGLVLAGTSARLHQVDGFEDFEGVMVAIPQGGRMPLPDVIATQRREQYGPLDVTTVQMIPCTSLARTVADIARYHPERYERAADDFQRRGCNLLWLQHTLDRMRRQRGDGLDMAFADLQRRRAGGTVRGSWFERLAEACVASPNIPTISRQYCVYTASGEFVARPDLAVPALRLAIEADSRKHHTGPAQEAFDERRENRLAEEGWQTSYVGWADAASPATVCRSIERIVARRAADLGVDLASLCAPAASAS